MNNELKKRLTKPLDFKAKPNPYKDNGFAEANAKHNRENPVSANDARKKIAAFKAIPRAKKK